MLKAWYRQRKVLIIPCFFCFFQLSLDRGMVWREKTLIYTMCFRDFKASFLGGIGKSMVQGEKSFGCTM